MTRPTTQLAASIALLLTMPLAWSQAPPGFNHDDPLALGVTVERIKGDHERTLLAYANTLQAAYDLGMARVSDVETVWGDPEDFVTRLRGGGIGIPVDGTQSASIDITLTDAYTEGRTLESVTVFIGGDTGTRNLNDFDLLYSTTERPGKFTRFFTASDGGPNPPNLGHGNKSPHTELQISGFGGAIAELHTLRLLARDATDRATSFGALTFHLSPTDPKSAIGKRLARLARKGRPKEPNGSGTVTVEDSRIHTFSEGMGWNIYMHDGVPAYTEEQLDELVGLLEWSGCEWVRAPILFAEWESENDNDDPFTLSKDALHFDQPKLSAAIRIWRRLDESDIRVLLCNWKFQTGWMSPTLRENPDASWEEWAYELVDSGEEIGESYAGLIMHLEEEGLDNVRAVSIMNEPDASISKGGYGPGFWALYAGMDRALRHYGLRDHVEIIGPELCSGPASLAREIEAYGDVIPLIDVISDHNYKFGFDYELGFQPSEGARRYAEVYRLLSERLDHEPRLVQGEFSADAGGTVDELYTESLSLAEQFVQNVNVGLDGQLRWNWGRAEPSDWMDSFRPLIQGADGSTQIHGPVFFPQALLSRYIRSGWDVLRCTVDGARDEDDTQRVFTTCLRSPDGDVTLLLVNDGFEPKQLTLAFASVTQSETLSILSVTGPVPTGIAEHVPLKLEDGTGTFTMQPRSIYAVTTLPPGDLSYPDRTTGKRLDAAALYETAIISEGDRTRIHHVLSKARRGEPVTIGVIGGSITGGAAASEWVNSYGPLVTEWWQATFPDCEVKLIAAGIGGTGSIYGALRAERDLLRHQPDFVITEFGVNDAADQACMDSVEGLTRQILSGDAANLMIFMALRGDDEIYNVQATQIPVGEHYDLPMLSFRDAVAQQIDEGRITWEDVHADVVHPNDRGHRLATDLIIHALEQALAALPEEGEIDTIPPLPPPLHAGAFEHVELHWAGEWELESCEGWSVEPGDWRGKWWASSTPGSTMELKVLGSVLCIYANRAADINGVAEVSVDGKSAKTYGWFDGDVFSSGLLFRDLGRGPHTVRVGLLDETWPQGDDHTVRIYAIGSAAIGE